MYRKLLAVALLLVTERENYKMRFAHVVKGKELKFCCCGDTYNCDAYTTAANA